MAPQPALERIPDKPQPRSRPATYSWLLLCGIITVLIATELTVRFAIMKASRIEARTEQEQRAALAIPHDSRASHTVLIVGNSLLLEGVDFPAIGNAMAPDFKAVRYIVEQTAYLDWYYGLRTLYSSGIRPGVVAVSLSANQLIARNIRGDYFAYRLLRTRDFLQAARDASLSPTATFSLLLGNLSAFYGTRSETRKVLLSKVVPSVKDLVEYMAPAAQPRRPLDRQRVVTVGTQRLRILDEMVRAHGGRFILIEPAALDPDDRAYLLEAGAKANVPVLAPLSSDVLSTADFRDGFHMSSRGAARYTTGLAPLLRAKCAEARE